MPLSREDRSQLLALVPELGPAGRASRFIDSVSALGPASLEELGELPGVDQLRAALLRALPELATEDLEERLRAADEALAVYPEMARSDDPVLTLTRHPSWVGLAALELAELRGEDGIDRAIRLASVGFEGTGGTAPGEVLWAMAEAAEESGWTARAAALLESASEARFDDESSRGEVRLLLALRYAEDDDPRAQELLTGILASTGPTRRRVHAAWVLAALLREPAPTRAIRVLSEALAMLQSDPTSEPEVVARVQRALADLGAPIAEG